MKITDARIAIVGATGLIGSDIQNVINEKKLQFKDIKLFASENSKGELYQINGESYDVKTLDSSSFDNIDIAFFAMPKELAPKYMKEAKEKNVICIDCVNASDDASPLIISNINSDKINQEKVLKNPCALAIYLAPILNIIKKRAEIKRVVFSSYEAVSSAGKMALDELWDQTLSIYNQKEIETDMLPHQIAFNCIPEIGEGMDEDGNLNSENRFIFEIQKILEDKNIKITGTRVRVPVFFSDALAVNIETTKELLPKDLIADLLKESDLNVFPENDVYPMQIDASGENDIYVGKIRKDNSVQYGLNMWIVADNVRRGSALNAVDIAVKAIENL